MSCCYPVPREINVHSYSGGWQWAGWWALVATATSVYWKKSLHISELCFSSLLNEGAKLLQLSEGVGVLSFTMQHCAPCYLQPANFPQGSAVQLGGLILPCAYMVSYSSGFPHAGGIACGNNESSSMPMPVGSHEIAAGFIGTIWPRVLSPVALRVSPSTWPFWTVSLSIFAVTSRAGEQWRERTTWLTFICEWCLQAASQHWRVMENNPPLFEACIVNNYSGLIDRRMPVTESVINMVALLHASHMRSIFGDRRGTDSSPFLKPHVTTSHPSAGPGWGPFWDSLAPSLKWSTASFLLFGWSSLLYPDTLMLVL